MQAQGSSPMIDGHVVKNLREALGETQTAFANRFGVGQPTIFKWERDGIKTRFAATAMQKLLDDPEAKAAVTAKAKRDKAAAKAAQATA